MNIFSKANNMAFISTFLGSSFGILGAKLSGNYSPLWLTACGLLIGALCSVHRCKEWRVSWKALVIGVGGLFLYHVFLLFAVSAAPVLEVMLLNYLWPSLIVVLSPVIFKNIKWRLVNVVLAFVGFIGAMLIITGGRVDSLQFANLAGYSAAIAAAFTWSIYSLLLKKMPAYPQSVMGLFCLLAGLLSLAAHCVFEQSVLFNWSDSLLVLMLGLGPLGGAFYFWNYAMKKGDPRIVGMISYLSPFLSTTLLFLFGYGETNAYTVIGGVLIVGSMLLGMVWQKN